MPARPDAPASSPPFQPGIYWRAVRAYSFPASIVPVLLGTALAARGYFGAPARFSPFLLLVTLAGALLAHAGGNVLNDYYDFVRGVDTRPEHGSGVLPCAWLAPKAMHRYGMLLLAAAGACGLLLLVIAPATSLRVVVLLATLGLACAVLYTPLLKRYALGDLVIMLAFGLGLTVGAYGVQTMLTSLAQLESLALAALPITLLVDAILHANNLRDAANDRANGVTTLASLLGPRAGGALQAFLLFGPVALVALYVLVIPLLPESALAVVLALPVLGKAYRSGDVPLCAQAHLFFGLLYAAGILAMEPPLPPLS